jgi:cell wall-associated NlpC family hydrolase/SH3-like domain-containing protein
MVKRILSAVIAAFAVGLAAEAQEKNTAEQEKRMAVVELSTIYMRQAPDYESALETLELMGTVVEIVGEKGYWREIVSPQPYKAWATEKGLVEMSAEELKAYEEAPKVMFSGLYGHVYMEPSFKAATLCDLVGGDVLRYEGKKGKWTAVMLPSGRKGYIPTEELQLHYGFRSIAQGEGSAESIRPETTEAIIAHAEKLLGVPYLWGGMSAKGVDCSGLVRISYIMNGIVLPRNASQQINCGDRIPMEIDTEYWNETQRTGKQPETYITVCGNEVAWSDDFRKEMLRRTKNLERGDLVFFGTPATEPGKKPRISHVGIYLGDGKIIHSSHKVRINSLIPGEEDYYENSWKLVGAVRL